MLKHFTHILVAVIALASFGACCKKSCETSCNRVEKVCEKKKSCHKSKNCSRCHQQKKHCICSEKD